MTAVDDPELSLRAAMETDIDAIVSLLDENGLPSADVRSKAESFYVAEAESKTIGSGALERCGPDGLLRSMVIAGPYRGRGWGKALCDRLEARARRDGIESLYLLTATATGFFLARDYEINPREGTPSSIRRTAQFTELCPETATTMTKRLR